MIRKAERQDISQLYDLIFSASGCAFNIFCADDVEMKKMLKLFYEQQDTRYYYEHVYVYEYENEIVGVIVLYDAANEDLYASHQKQLVKEELGLEVDFPIEALTDHYYLDTIAVSKNMQGKGIANQLIEYIKQHTQKPICLIVEKSKTATYEYYQRRGFETVGEKYIYEIDFYVMSTLKSRAKA